MSLRILLESVVRNLDSTRIRDVDVEALARGGSDDEGHRRGQRTLGESQLRGSDPSEPIGTEVKIEGPFGSLTLYNNIQRPAVLLAGGIGITPFRSIVRRAAHEKLPYRIFLFYANRRPEDAPFLDELRDLAQKKTRVKEEEGIMHPTKNDLPVEAHLQAPR